MRRAHSGEPGWDWAALGVGMFGLVLAVLLSVALAVGCPAAAHAQETPVGDAPVTVATRVRHVTTIALPESAEIVDVMVGDAESWDVSSSAHLAFVRPLLEGAESNLVLLTARGDIFPVVIVERSDAPAAAVVRVGIDSAPVHVVGRVLAAADSVEAVAARAAEAWAEVAAAEDRAATRIEAAREAAQAELDADRERYPRELRFDYRWPFGSAPADWPWLVEAMWHDGQRTYLRTRATSPALYELVDGELTDVEVARVLDGVVLVVPRVLGSGALEVGDERLRWLVASREAGP